MEQTEQTNQTEQDNKNTEVEQTEQTEQTPERYKIIKLINSDLVIGRAFKGDNDSIIVEKPYTIKNLGKGPMVMPYEMDLLVHPMEVVSFQGLNVIWIKNLSEFKQVEEQYMKLAFGLEI